MSKKRMGRPPLGDKAMTPAERAKRWRQNRSNEGAKSFFLMFDPDSHERIEKLAARLGVTPTEAVRRAALAGLALL